MEMLNDGTVPYGTIKNNVRNGSKGTSSIFRCGVIALAYKMMKTPPAAGFSCEKNYFFFAVVLAAVFFVAFFTAGFLVVFLDVLLHLGIGRLL